MSRGVFRSQRRDADEQDERGPVARFLASERREVGWRFWLLWVLATNAGFFPGLYVAARIASHFDEPWASGVAALQFSIPVGFLQWLVLRRHLARSAQWLGSTAIGWTFGAFLGSLLLRGLAPQVAPGGLVWIVTLAALAGLAIGLLQRDLVRRYRPSLLAWWPWLSALAWAAQMPGVVTGAFLARGPAPRDSTPHDPPPP